MAFDLNKNNGSAKFDLSKTELKETVATEERAKSKKTIVGLLIFLLAGGGFLYYATGGVSEKNKDAAMTERNASDSKVASKVEELKLEPVVENSGEVELKTNPENKKTLLKFNHKIAATFTQGSSTVNQMNQSMVNQLLSYLSENPATVVQINGYASSDGTLEVNKIISQARADAFKQHLLSKNVKEDRIVALGKGIENPIATNETNAGRRKNRRVEIVLP